MRLRSGISKEDAKVITKKIKDTKLKVQAQIQDEQVRVTGKKIDDLQEVTAMLKGANILVPLQYKICATKGKCFMSLACGFVGLPNVGKSTIYTALTQSQVAAENYPFCTIEPNVGLVTVPDSRLATISGLIKTQRVVPATVEFVDIAGLVAGASKGEGLGNKFLGHIRATHALVHVVRCFDGEVTHVDGSVDPLRDIKTIQDELIFADYETVSNNMTRYQKLAKSMGKESQTILTMLESLESHLQALKPARNFEQVGEIWELPEVRDAYRNLHLLRRNQFHMLVMMRIAVFWQ